MAEAMLFSMAESLIKKLGSKALEEIAAAWGFKDQLKKLNRRANSIKCLLSDAEEKQVRSHQVRDWLEQLSSVVYDADDLFDEFSTKAMRKELRKELMPGCTLSKEVCLFFSNYNQAVFAFKMARQVKKIRGELDDIEEQGEKYGLVKKLDDQVDILKALNLGSRETCSYVDADRVIGRDDEKEKIVEMLMLDRENISVVSIVGIGGMGKTTLAQLVFNDDKIKNHFKIKLWVCVGDVGDKKKLKKFWYLRIRSLKMM